MKTWTQTTHHLAQKRAQQLYQGYSEDSSYIAAEIHAASWIYETSPTSVIQAMDQHLPEVQDSR